MGRSLVFYREKCKMREVDMRGLWPAALDRIYRILQNLLGLPREALPFTWGCYFNLNDGIRGTKRSSRVESFKFDV